MRSYKILTVLALTASTVFSALALPVQQPAPVQPLPPGPQVDSEGQVVSKFERQIGGAR